MACLCVSARIGTLQASPNGLPLCLYRKCVLYRQTRMANFCVSVGNGYFTGQPKWLVTVGNGYFTSKPEWLVFVPLPGMGALHG
ncbi:hypothetical protein CEXT_233161 [Caerostris extrusa]|uniref:Uncharacterized protein n=1 Tax=Caerostris extrusa TaxID=172846 RepID=A0AAV4XV60_CAEEX|nr:hypothetical protein CEXT_233161 [Caerostris extrusa]